MATAKLRPLGDRVVIKPTPREEMTKSGIVLPDTAKEKPQEGEIIAVGPGRILDDGKRETMDVKKGEKVLYAKYAGTEFKVDGEELLIVGDAAHHPVHFEHHDWIPGVDLDRAASTRSRGKLAALAADRGALVTGGHFPILTLGHVRRVEGGYRWEGVPR